MSDRPQTLYVLDSFLPRSEVFIYNYYRAHTAWKPIILCCQRQNADEFPAEEIYQYPMASAPSLFSMGAIRFWGSRLVEKVTGQSPWQHQVKALLKRIRPDVIHAHFAPMGWAVAPVARELGIPLVTTCYAWDISVLPRQALWRRRYQDLFAACDLFLIEGPHLSELAMDLGMPEEKIRIQHIAIEMEKYPSWKPSWENPTVLFVGRFVEKKGLIYALKAFCRIRDEIPNARFRVIGDGPEKPRALDYVRTHNLAASVQFLGMKPHHEMIAELVKANALIYPSVWAANGDNEGGIGTVLLEAQAVGTPIVSTYHADLPYGLASVPGIYLATERSVDGLVARLRQALQEQVRVDSRFVRERHDVQKEVVRLEEKYQTLVDRRRNLLIAQ